MTPLLETAGLTRFFGMVRAAEKLDLRVEEGELVGIVGSNGSGKTTFLNMVTGYIRPDAGRILLAGRETSGLSPRQITGLGVGRSFQIPQLYTGLTVLENMLLALAARSGGGHGVWGPLHRERSIGEGEAMLQRFGLETYSICVEQLFQVFLF